MHLAADITIVVLFLVVCLTLFGVWLRREQTVMLFFSSWAFMLALGYMLAKAVDRMFS